MDAGLDTGPIVEAVDVPIAPRETGGTLHDKLAAAGAEAIVEVLARLARDGVLAATPQPVEGATYAAKIARDDAVVDWAEPATTIERRIRAFDPAPGVTTTLAGHPVKLWTAQPVAAGTSAGLGTIIAAGPAGIDVACGRIEAGQALRILELQPAGGRRMDAAAFIAGHQVHAGMTFAAGRV
jgi:methionyl-tRNA formyltransferase